MNHDELPQGLLDVWAEIERERGRLSVSEPAYWDLKDRANRWLSAKSGDHPWAGERLRTYRPLFVEWPRDRADLWRRVDRFIDAWDERPLGRESGVTESEWSAAEERLGVTLPAALREWHLLAGRRRELWDPPDPDGFEYNEPNIWSPDTFCWLGDEEPKAYYKTPERDRIDRFRPLIVSAIHGGMQSDTFWIKWADLGRDDPPLSDHDGDSKVDVREGFASVTNMAVCLLVARTVRAAPIGLSLGIQYNRGEPDLSRVVQDATGAGLWRRWEWFEPFFDVIPDVRVNEVYEGDDCLVTRHRLYQTFDKDRRDFLHLAFRTPRAARDMTEQLGLKHRVPAAWWAEPSRESIWM